MAQNPRARATQLPTPLTHLRETTIPQESMIYTLSSAIPENAQEFPLGTQRKKGFCFQTNRFCSSVNRSVLGFSSVLARGCSPAWSSHHWQAPSQSGGSLISPKVSAIRPTLPSQNQRARPHSKTTEGNKKKETVFHTYSPTSNKGLSPSTKYMG